MEWTEREDVEIPKEAIEQIEADADEALRITLAVVKRRGLSREAIVGPLAAAVLEKLDHARGRAHTRVAREEQRSAALERFRRPREDD